MGQAETLPSRILTERLSGPEGDPIRIHLTRLEVRLQLSYQQETSEMRAHLPLEHHEDHRDRHRSISHDNRGGDSRSNQAGPESLHNRVLNLTQLPDRGKAKG